jgi:hypothetical protein
MRLPNKQLNWSGRLVRESRNLTFASEEAATWT